MAPQISHLDQAMPRLVLYAVDNTPVQNILSRHAVWVYFEVPLRFLQLINLAGCRSVLILWIGLIAVG